MQAMSGSSCCNKTPSLTPALTNNACSQPKAREGDVILLSAYDLPVKVGKSRWFIPVNDVTNGNIWSLSAAIQHFPPVSGHICVNHMLTDDIMISL